MAHADPAIEIVLAWHRALNAGDVARLLSLSADDVEVGGPRGSGQGAGLLEEWVARAAIQMDPRRVFARAASVVVEQSARWRGADGSYTEPQDAATVFRVADGKVASVIRFPELGAALRAPGLDLADAAPT